MQRYFSKTLNNNYFTLSEEDSYHIKTVMRMKETDKIEVIYENNGYICEIVSIDTNVKCKIVDNLKTKEKNIPNVVIAQALVKEQKMDYILQKTTELGVYSIIPVSTERSIVKLDTKENKKIERWNKVLKEASEQSKRYDIPILQKVLKLEELIKLDIKYKYICSVNEKSKTIKSVLSKLDINDTILLVIGPEGGLSKKEEEYLMNHGFESLSFGENVLRTETASLFVLSAINYEFMR